MNAYDHDEIISIDDNISDVQVSFKCKEIGGREYHVTAYATVYMETLEEEGDHLHPTFVDSEVRDITITDHIITDIEGYPIHKPYFNTPITEDFLKDQVLAKCVTV